MGKSVVSDILSSQPTVALRPQFRILLDVTRKLTLFPEAVTPGDVAVLQLAGLDRVAVTQGILIVVGFNFINRVADTLHFEIPTSDQCLLSARFLLYFGYRALAGPRVPFHGDPWIKVADPNNVDLAEGDLSTLTDSTANWLRFLSRLGFQAYCSAPAVMRRILHKVLYQPVSVTPDDVADLKRHGCTEASIFNLVLGAAADAALLRLEAGLQALVSNRPTAPVVETHQVLGPHLRVS
jgi:hypothetical protein